MDPQTTWIELQTAYSGGDWERAGELAEALLDWLDKGGFPPWTCGDLAMGEDWDRVVSRAAAEHARVRAAEQ